MVFCSMKQQFQGKKQKFLGKKQSVSRHEIFVSLLKIKMKHPVKIAIKSLPGIRV